ncbi:MAG: glutamate synthase large subunit [Campylobacterales bacterium]
MRKDYALEFLTEFKDNCGFGLIANIKNKPSHSLLGDAITSLERMMHRGAIAADGKSGDGSGLLLSMPTKFIKKIAKQNGVVMPEQFGAAMVFLKDEKQEEIFTSICEKNDLKVLFSRVVPLNKSALGELALKTLPIIKQYFVAPNSVMAYKRFEAILYLTRKEIENKLKKDRDFYIASFSNKLISYKGLVMPTHIKEFYPDLNDRDFEISFALFHQRFSTNTLPEWRLAQPFRSIAHNGEINSITANRFNVGVKCESLKSPVFTKDEVNRIVPVIEEGMSDSASLDNMFEFLVSNGMDFFKAARSLIPAPWQNAPQMDSKLRAFYEYTSTRFEAWDGPAAVSLTDGRYIACILDRNGLRPAKYVTTKDDRLLISSEYGVLDIDEDIVIERGRLQSGEMIGLDLKFGRILKNDEIDEYLKNSNPYTDWLNKHMVYIQESIGGIFSDYSDYELPNLNRKQRYFNVTLETIEQVIEPMIKDGKEAVGSMGDDTPIAAFSTHQRQFNHFFKQKFAQVTNPPIDPYREKVVMSLNTGFSEIHNIIDETPSHAKRLKSVTPVLPKEKLDVLLAYGDESAPLYESYYKNRSFSLAFEKDLEKALTKLKDSVIKAVKKDGVRVVILDDREISSTNMTIPMAMAVGRINYALYDEGIRHLVSIVAISGEAIDAHDIAVIIAYGANAIYPYMLFCTINEMVDRRSFSAYDKRVAFRNSLNALGTGILKIMSKMGISSLASYRCSALFDVIGLSQEVVNDCFRGSRVALGGLSYTDIEERIFRNHEKAFAIEEMEYMLPIKIGGYYKYVNGGEYHDFNPNMVFEIQKASLEGNVKAFRGVKNLVENRGIRFIRDCFKFKSDREPIELKAVEKKESILKRFESAAMSLGSISPEAHEMIAEAMNKIGGRSNSGEGGELEERLKSSKNSKIKQIASGRFGVTPAYLRSADEIQIKVAQGAKPGEGGQLPGHKVTPLIATLRYTVPGVTLISPPPHHDIYSIEDLAQLIFDLKQVNPNAKITVKLVSTLGVGTIAAGVAKAYADKIIISGSDGGTGAAPLSSIKFAGNPWEIGLSEAHNALKANHLREFVELQTDGGLKSGVDIVKAAMLGSESYGFGTVVLAMVGCKILRVCHLNRCTTGVATQDTRLREHYVGSVERIVNYFNLLAEDIREILASIGYKSLNDIIGRSDLLELIDDEMVKKFDFSSVLLRIKGEDRWRGLPNRPFDENLYEKEILEEIYETIKSPKNRCELHKVICNINRSFGARISGEIAKFYGNKGLPSDSIKLNLKGIAGQSFGAFLLEGISLYLQGAANDYVGKGMNGGKIVITPKTQEDGKSCAGNTCLYGATGGKLFVAGEVGERFGVRNSGAQAIIEGTGDHACEYMTGGAVVILGNTGINFGAGMTGGIAFVYDEGHKFFDKINQELIDLRRIDIDDMDEARHFLKNLLKEHYLETKSIKAKNITDNFRDEVRNFWMVVPKNMKKLPLHPEDGD